MKLIDFQENRACINLKLLQYYPGDMVLQGQVFNISSTKHEGMDNPNYGEVDPYGSQRTSTQIAVDYEVPQSNHTSPKYINIPSQNLAHSSSNSGIYSYVIRP